MQTISLFVLLYITGCMYKFKRNTGRQIFAFAIIRSNAIGSKHHLPLHQTHFPFSQKCLLITVNIKIIQIRITKMYIDNNRGVLLDKIV